MTEHVRVVGGAIVEAGRVLAARRAYPADAVGGWEFAGGKVEAGESDEVALARELLEELGVRIHVGSLIGSARDDRIEMHLYHVTLDGGCPTAQDDHDELRWVAASELRDLAWLPIDRQLLDRVAAQLTEP